MMTQQIGVKSLGIGKQQFSKQTTQTSSELEL